MRKLGPKFVVIKKGEHGAMFFSEHETYVLPAYPTDRVVDPTGAGDSFAGGLLGYLAKTGDLSSEGLRRAVMVASATASFCVESVGPDRLKSLGERDVQERIHAFEKLLSFGASPLFAS